MEEKLLDSMTVSSSNSRVLWHDNKKGLANFLGIGRAKVNNTIDSNGQRERRWSGVGTRHHTVVTGNT